VVHGSDSRRQLSALPDARALQVNPTSLSFQAVQGGTNPPSQIVNILKNNDRTLNWSSSDNATWVSVSPTTGNITNSAQISVSVNPAGLAAGAKNEVGREDRLRHVGSLKTAECSDKACNRKISGSAKTRSNRRWREKRRLRNGTRSKLILPPGRFVFRACIHATTNRQPLKSSFESLTVFEAASLAEFLSIHSGQHQEPKENRVQR